MFLAPATPMFSFMREQSSGLRVSTAAHVLLLMLLSVSLMSSPARPTLRQIAIEATVIDAGALKRAQAEWKQQVQLEEERREEQRRHAAEEEQRRKERVEQERLQRIRFEEEAEKKAEAELQRKEEKKREDIARQEAEQARLRAEREAELLVAMEAEERLMAAEQAGLLAQYIGAIRQKVERNWVRPASADTSLECIVHVTQIPGGEVVGVRLGECNGDAVVVRSIEAAVYRSSPLPFPPNRELFERNLRFTFKPEE